MNEVKDHLISAVRHYMYKYLDLIQAIGEYEREFGDSEELQSILHRADIIGHERERRENKDSPAVHGFKTESTG